jgi:hypothetical protein
MNEAKQEILATRTGCLGGSDAKLIQGIAIANKIPQSAMKRLAVCKGLAEQPQFTNTAIEFGNYVESMVFESLHSQDERWQSNPCLVSTKYSRPNCKVIDHVDFFLQDDEKKVLVLGECKATRSTFEQTHDEYKWQLLHHYLLGCEKAKELGGYKVKVMLCHYLTDGIDLTQPFEFDPSRLTVKTLRNMEKLSKSYHLAEAMDIIDNFLETFTEYYEDGEEIPYEILPANVQNQFDSITTLLTEIKEREDKVAAFKSKLYDFLTEKNIKSIRNDAWSITRVDPTESKQFDSKRYLEDFAAKHPRQFKKVRSEYEKTVRKKGFITIKIK